MDRNKAAELLDKYLKGACSEEEKHLVEQWYQSYERKDLHLDESAYATIENKLRAEIHSSIAPEKTHSLKPYFWSAAAVTLALGVAFIFLYLTRKPQAVLLTTRSTQAGERLKIRLSDGSEIWLNAASAVRYPQRFAHEERVVELLEGEALFQVTHDEKHPFKVALNNGIYTKVLGTSFTVRDYSDDEEVKVSVLTGRVAVGTSEKLFGRLSKDEQIIYNKATLTASIQPVTQPDSWVNGMLVFNGNTIKEAAVLLARAYGIRVLVEGGAKVEALRCSGKFSLTQSPQSIVKVLCSLHDLSYETKNDTIIMTSRRMKK